MANIVEHPRKKLTEAPVGAAKRMAQDGDLPVPEEMFDASSSQRRALLSGLRERVGIRRDEEAWPLSDAWLLGSRGQAESVAALLESIGVEAVLAGRWRDERSGSGGEAVLVKAGAFEQAVQAGGAR